LANEGATVALWDTSDTVHEVSEAMRVSGYNAVSYPVDVVNEDRTAQAAAEIQDRFGSLDILVNNAGIAHFSPFLEMDNSQRDKVFNVNFFGAWNCCKAILPLMIQQDYGRVINISSVTGPRVATAGLTAYAATKGALSALTRTLALEVAAHHVTVNAILPGFIDTALTKPMADDMQMDEKTFSQWLQQSIPLKRFGTIEELGSLAVFLASNESGYITGQEIVIDGGNTIQEVKRIQ